MAIKKSELTLKSDEENDDKLNKIFARLAEAYDLKGVIDVAERYAEPLLQLANDVTDLSARVKAHLKQTGFSL